MPPMTVVRILREFPEGGLLSPWRHMKAKSMTHVISDVSWMDWIVFFYLNLILMSSLFMNWAFVLFTLWQKAVTKLAGTFLWRHCINRGPFGEWDGTSQRSGLFTVCGNGWIEWLLACLETARIWCWLPLSNAGDGLTATSSKAGDRAALLVSDWVSACFHLRAVKWNKSVFTCWFLYFKDNMQQTPGTHACECVEDTDPASPGLYGCGTGAQCLKAGPGPGPALLLW